MAADDIFHVQAIFEAPTGEASVGIYYRENSPQTGPGLGTQALADAWDSAFRLPVINVLANDWWFPSIIVRKVYDEPTPMSRLDSDTQVGAGPAPSLPANNCLQINLTQNAFGARHNGKSFWPGVSEANTNIGVFTNAFLNGPVSVLRDLMFADVDELSGTGVWKAGVINRLILDSSPPIKDWDGAFAEIVNASYSPIIATQRRRQTKVKGMVL